ncbi:MAG: hypothetical protein ACR2OW_00250, partial [Methyloligellaceae bacterium]
MTLNFLRGKLALTFLALIGSALAVAGTSASIVGPLSPSQVEPTTHEIQSVQKESADALDVLFLDLKSAVDESAASEIENKIWELWLRSGDDAIDKLMQRAMFFMNSGLFQDSLTLLNEIINQKPKFSEAWN